MYCRDLFNWINKLFSKPFRNSSESNLFKGLLLSFKVLVEPALISFENEIKLI